MVEIVVNTTLLAGLFAYWFYQLIDNGNLKITEIVEILDHLPVTRGGYQILREYLETMSDDLLALERLLEDFGSFMTVEEIKAFSKHLNELCGNDDDNDEMSQFDDEWTNEAGDFGYDICDE